MTQQKIDDGGPAFPTTGPRKWNGRMWVQADGSSPGMSVRMWLAGTATDADVYTFRGNTNGLTSEAVRTSARFRYADAMIQALRKDTPHES